MSKVRRRSNIAGVARRTALAAALALVGLVQPAMPAMAEPIPAGLGAQDVRFGDDILPLYTYKPACPNPSLLVVFHGLGRNAEGARRDAKPLADTLCLLVVAPLFGREFRSWAYQRGGIVRRGQVRDVRDWTVGLVPRIVAWARAQEGRPLDCFLLGHSAGAQFLSRVAAFAEVDARRIVVANASSYVVASLDEPAPYGFGGVFDAAKNEGALRRYLARPVTIMVGREDVGSKNLSMVPQAVAQGDTRYARGVNVFRSAEESARKRGWSFNWRLVEVPGVGHSARRMYAAPEAIQALRS